MSLGFLVIAKCLKHIFFNLYICNCLYSWFCLWHSWSICLLIPTTNRYAGIDLSLKEADWFISQLADVKSTTVSITPYRVNGSRRKASPPWQCYRQDRGRKSDRVWGNCFLSPSTLCNDSSACLEFSHSGPNNTVRARPHQIENEKNHWCKLLRIFAYYAFAGCREPVPVYRLQQEKFTFNLEWK